MAILLIASLSLLTLGAAVLTALSIAGLIDATPILRHFHAWRHTTLPSTSIPQTPVNILQSPNFFGRPLSAAHGPVYQVMAGVTPVLVIADWEVAKEYYRTQPQHLRTPSFSVLGSVCSTLLGNAVGTKTGKQWTRHRAPFKTEFGSGTANGRSHLYQRHVRTLVSNIHSHASSASASASGFSVEDIGLHRFTLDILSDVCYGPSLADTYRDDIHRIAALHDSILPHMASSETRIPGYHLLPTKLNNDLREFASQWVTFNDMMWDAIPAESDCVVGHLKHWTAVHAATPGKSLSRSEVYANLEEILLFNIDVMLTALGALFTNLAVQPLLQEELRAEVEAMHGNQEATEKPLLGRLPLLDSFIKESARTCPSLALSFPEKTHTDRVIGGFHVPRGTTVVVDIMSINHNATHFPSPDTFDPTRFRCDDPDAAVRARQFHRFGLGSRKCMGQNYAQAVISAVMVEVLTTLRLSPAAVDGSSGRVMVDGEAVPKGQPSAGVKTRGLAFFTPYSEFPRLKGEAMRRYRPSHPTPATGTASVTLAVAVAASAGSTSG